VDKCCNCFFCFAGGNFLLDLLKSPVWTFDFPIFAVIKKGLAIWPHFEFNYILNLYVLSMYFVRYPNWIVCTLYNVAPMLFFILENF
jgi:hypothetical protein